MGNKVWYTKNVPQYLGGGRLLKKVISVLTMLAVLILGTAVGVAVSASHLNEKTLLDAGDVWVAMASQGLPARPATGGFDRFAASSSRVAPKVFKADGMYVLVYEYDDASVRLQQHSLPPDQWRDRSSLWVVGVDSWRNLDVVYAYPRTALDRLKASGTLHQRSRQLAQLSAMEGKVAVLRHSLRETLNTIRTAELQTESAAMRYTIELRYYCMPADGGEAGLLYDCSYWSRLKSCTYKEPPQNDRQRTAIQLVLGQKRGEETIVYDPLYWNGQGVLRMDELFADSVLSGGRLDRAPMELRYRIDVQRGGSREQAKVTFQLEP